MELDPTPPACDVSGPWLKTNRLVLRPFEPGDAPQVQHLCSDIEIAANTRGIEHPYPDGAALTWIESHAEQWKSGRAVVFAICNSAASAQANSAVPAAQPGRQSEPSTANAAPSLSVFPEGLVLGVMLLNLDADDHRGELGYWVGKPFWNQGIATEAAQAVLQFAFSTLGLNRITAHHLARNKASGQVLRKLGMTREGLLRQHARKWGQFHDVVLYGLLSNDGPVSTLDPQQPV